MQELVKKIGFFSAFVLIVFVVVGFYLGGVANYLAVFFTFIVLPLLDEGIGVSKANVSESESKIVGAEFYYRFVTYCWTYVQVAFLFWGAYAVTTGQLHNVFEWVGFILSFSLVTGGVGITVAHELGHKKTAIEKVYSKLLLMTVCYMHFYIEHNRGHHVQVATLNDPATARKDENFYFFWVRSVFQGYAHAWHLERDRLLGKGLSFWSFKNEMIGFTFAPILFCCVLSFIFSYVKGHFAWEVPLFFILQSIAAFTLLELVNYIEHYGILRKEIFPQKFERVNPLHSWNASQILSNFFLFQLQRHSDHHAFAHKRYQVLNHYDESPQLPFGYPTMIVIALLPPLWFAMMNKRLSVWQIKEGTK
jgi:alkane 1-monooxygenase